MFKPINIITEFESSGVMRFRVTIKGIYKICKYKTKIKEEVILVLAEGSCLVEDLADDAYSVAHPLIYCLLSALV
jgi:hypothetical protein